MQYNYRKALLGATILLVTSLNAYSQTDPDQIRRARLFLKTDARVTVFFTSDLDDKHLPEIANPGNVTVNAEKTKNIKVQSIIPAIGDPKVLLVILDDEIRTRLQTEDKQVTVCFTTVFFGDKKDTPVRGLCGSGPILKDADAVKAETDVAIQEAKKTEKTSDEKNIFASGFVAKGSGANTEGGAEIHLNSTDMGIPGLNAFAHLDKTTAANADPKHFSLGLKYTGTYLLNPSQIKQIAVQDEILRKNQPNSDEYKKAIDEIENLKKQMRAKTLGAVLFDFSSGLEAEAMNFHVTNFIGETLVELVSRTKSLGARNGFWNFRLIGGFEGGKNIGKNTDATQMMSTMTPQQAQQLKDVDWIARVKVGGKLAFYYKNLEGRFLFKHVEANLQAVERNLFLREVMFDPTTMKDVMTDKGSKPWYQADMKFYLAESDKGRFGFKISYNHGSLPPVFAYTNSFNFGFIVETADDLKTGKQ